MARTPSSGSAPFWRRSTRGPGRPWCSWTWNSCMPARRKHPQREGAEEGAVLRGLLDKAMALFRRGPLPAVMLGPSPRLDHGPPGWRHPGTPRTVAVGDGLRHRPCHRGPVQYTHGRRPLRRQQSGRVPARPAVVRAPGGGRQGPQGWSTWTAISRLRPSCASTWPSCRAWCTRAR